MGMMPLEAMASRKESIVSREGRYAEKIFDGTRGTLIPRITPKRFVLAIQKMGGLHSNLSRCAAQMRAKEFPSESSLFQRREVLSDVAKKSDR